MGGEQPKGEEGKICQMGIVVWDLDEALERYTKELGYGPWGVWDFSTPDLTDVLVRGVRVESVGYKIALCTPGAVQVELIQPLYGTTIHTEFLEEHGEGIHHVKMYYQDVWKAAKEFEKQGIYPLQSGRFENDIHIYMDTEERYGIIWELGNQEDVGDPEEVYPK